jgi:polysaccharide export outer membrane protein
MASRHRLVPSSFGFCGIIGLLALLLGTLLSAQTAPARDKTPALPVPAVTATTTAPPSLPGPDSDLIISPDDVLDIYVMDVPELSRQYRVSPGGTILLPLLDKPMMAAGINVSTFSATLAKELSQRGLVSNPHIMISIASSRLKAVAITGAVKRPQIYPVFGHTTLLDMLSQAEGLEADASKVAIVSRGDLGQQMAKSGERVQTIDLKKLMETGDAAHNIDIYPGDRVTIPRAGVVYVVGAVNKPGGFPINSTGDGMTVLQAIAMAEDLKPTAIGKKAMVIRVDTNAPDGHSKIPLNVSDILSAKVADPVLQANDILFIPDSQSARAMRRGLEAIIQTATGVAIYGSRF